MQNLYILVDITVTVTAECTCTALLVESSATVSSSKAKQASASLMEKYKTELLPVDQQQEITLTVAEFEKQFNTRNKYLTASADIYQISFV